MWDRAGKQRRARDRFEIKYGLENKQMTGKIDLFRGEYYFLSNFFTTAITYDGITYKNSEAAFQSAKLVDMEQRKQFASLSGGEAKKLGQKVHIRDDWEQAKYNIMHDIVSAKFSQNDDIRQKLLNTGDCKLEEGNTWGDKTWGTVNGEGKNWLGEILMAVRDELRE